MNKIVIPVLLLVATLWASAADTKSLKNPDGNCELSVPSDWSVGSYGDGQSSNKTVKLIVSSPKHGISTMAQVRQMAPSMYTDDKVLKDTSSEFEMGGMGTSGKPNFYLAVPAGARVCIAEITYESGTADDAKAILETLKSVK